MLKCSINKKPNKHFKNNKQPWFNSECYDARSMFKRKRNIFLRNKHCVYSRQEYIPAKTAYNKTKRFNKMKCYNNEKTKAGKTK
jgi:hypothetical protein